MANWLRRLIKSNRPTPETISPKLIPSYVYFAENLVFPATKNAATYTLAAFRVSDRTRYLLASKAANTGIVAGILQAERRIERRELINDVFYGVPNYGINFTAYFTFPTRQVTIFSFGLHIDHPGYSSDAIAREVCKFLQWQAGELKAERQVLTFYGGLDIPESALLTSNYSLVRMFWLTAIAAKISNMVKK
jgi:hypothetical protein